MLDLAYIGNQLIVLEQTIPPGIFFIFSCERDSVLSYWKMKLFLFTKAEYSCCAFPIRLNSQPQRFMLLFFSESHTRQNLYFNLFKSVAWRR